MTIYKTFDCMEMPSDIRDAFYAVYKGTSKGVYIEWKLRPHEDVNAKLVDAWLLTKGVKETVLIKHW